MHTKSYKYIFVQIIKWFMLIWIVSPKVGDWSIYWFCGHVDDQVAFKHPPIITSWLDNTSHFWSSFQIWQSWLLNMVPLDSELSGDFFIRNKKQLTSIPCASNHGLWQKLMAKACGKSLWQKPWVSLQFAVKSKVNIFSFNIPVIHHLVPDDFWPQQHEVCDPPNPPKSEAFANVFHGRVKQCHKPPHVLMVYTTNLWSKWGWFIIALL